mmetsp:Transcript_9620/g.17872  ORF Transcript_9620/g.17872 Transcript_9620/m.17872 type:complete len:90 (+) Transcript_9620:1-270(+)
MSYKFKHWSQMTASCGREIPVALQKRTVLAHVGILIVAAVGVGCAFGNGWCDSANGACRVLRLTRYASTVGADCRLSFVECKALLLRHH